MQDEEFYANMEELTSTTEIGGGLVAAELESSAGSTIASLPQSTATYSGPVEPDLKLANEVLAKSLLLVEQVAENPTVKEILEAQNLELLQMPAIPAETLAAIEEQNAQLEKIASAPPVTRVVYIPTAAPIDAVSKPIDTSHIQVGHIHFRNPA